MEQSSPTNNTSFQGSPEKPISPNGPAEAQRITAEKTQAWAGIMESMDQSVEVDGQYFGVLGHAPTPEDPKDTRAYVLRAPLQGINPAVEDYIVITPDGPMRISTTDQGNTNTLRIIVKNIADGNTGSIVKELGFHRNNANPDLVTVDFNTQPTGEPERLRIKAVPLDPNLPADQEALNKALRKSKEITPSKAKIEEAKASIDMARRFGELVKPTS